MKSFFKTLTLIVALNSANNLSAQTIYSVTKDQTISGAGIPTSCTNCTINISKGITLTINQEMYLQNTTFNGGNILANKKITFWSDGAFNDVNVQVKNNSAIVSSGALAIKNSTFTFLGNSTATFWAPVTMSASKMNFLGNSSAEITSAFNLVDNSFLIAGDGTSASAAFIKFNGGTLNEFDNSYVTMAGPNNYYFNWASYNAAGKAISTVNNVLNCGKNGKNACSAPVVYGPATLSTAGMGSSAVLPVKLTAFGAKANGTQVDLAWTTNMEKSSDRFEIERSLDGLNWVKVGTVKSHGNSNDVNNYSFTDILKLNGSANYRLKMVDQDEVFAYSSIKTVKTAASAEMSIFPNPAVNYVVINSADNETKNIALINMNGQVVKQINGKGSVNMNVTEVNAGQYFVRVTNANGEAQNFKLLVRK